MYPNINTGMGMAMATALTVNRAFSGRIFIVAKDTAPNISELKAMYGTGYNDGIAGVFPTLALAVAKCRADAGDTIIIAPGHTENISSATALTLSVANIYIRGLGNGNDRPIFTLDTATTATINVTAANITVSNVIFVANFAAIASAFTLTAAKDFFLSFCEFRDTSSILNFVNIVDTNTTSNDADGLRIEDSKRIGAGATTATTIIKMDSTIDRLSIKRNYFAHNAVTDAGLMIIATGKIVTNVEIADNVINLVGTTGATTGIIITTNGTTNSGFLARNMVQSLDATTEILVTASSGFIFFNNYYSATADKSGYLLPAADA